MQMSCDKGGVDQSLRGNIPGNIPYDQTDTGLEVHIFIGGCLREKNSKCMDEHNEFIHALTRDIAELVADSFLSEDDL